MKKMKKIMLSAIVLGGLLGAATTQAGDFGYGRGGGSVYVQPSSSYGYYSGGSCGYNGRYGQHEALHQDVRAEHRDLHADPRDAHQDLHQELRHERAQGASGWEIQAEHREAHRQLSDAHQDGHAQLRDAHRSGHSWLRW